MRIERLLSLLLLTSVLTAGGCGALKDKVYTPTEAEKKLAAFCLKEGNLNIVTKRMGLTLWIYAPIQEPIFNIKASPDRGTTERKVQPFSLLSLEADFSEKFFRINYDIVPDVLAPEPTSYGSSYNEAYTKKRQLMYQALQESFFNAKDAPKDPMPEFVVIMVADITKGIATKSVLYLRDLRQYVTEVLPPAEYYMREANEIIGKESLIQDTAGKNVPYAEITWSWFLTEQIKTRVKTIFSGAVETKDTQPDAEITLAAANTLRFYPFEDYNGVLIYDVRNKGKTELTKDVLMGYAKKAAWEDPNKKLTTIHFRIPTDPTEGLVVNSVTTTEEEIPE